MPVMDVKRTLGFSLILTLAIAAWAGASALDTPLSFDESLYSGIRWRLVGPFRGGRAGTVAGVRGNGSLYYMGTAGGGVWRTTDSGATWECVSDGYFGGSIGAVAVAESDPNVLYVGEGEETVRGNVSSGWGVWKSTDAGKSWKHIGLRESEHVGRIRVHPENPELVYVAAMGSLWAPNETRGVYRSRDGGETWKKVLYESNQAGAVDLILDPNNPRIVYASTWEVKRIGFRFDSGGPGSHLWKSTDGGDSWEKLTGKPGLPEGTLGIIGVTVSPVSSERVWAIIEAEDGGVFRSDDGGETWTKTNEDRGLRQRAWYYSRIYADTQNEDIVYVMNVRYYRSKDGGVTFEAFNAPHGDHHDLWIDPDDNARMVIADDGGAQISNDGGKNWTTYHNQPTAQFYRVTTDEHFPFRIYGAQQDNSTLRIAHRTSGPSITERDWEPSAGGESAHLAPDPDDPDIVYGGSYKGYMMRIDHNTAQVRSTNVWPDNPAGSGVEVMKYRFNWNFPILFSPHDSNKLYVGSNRLHATTNEGQSWDIISPDLTRNDPETLVSSGGPITQDNTGVEFYGTIFAVNESKYEEGVIWVGSDDGLVHVTRDGGESWQNVTPPETLSPRQNMMNCIDVNPFVEGGAYIAATSYKFGDYRPYLYKTTDYGKSWTRINEGIDAVHYTRVIRADPERQGLLYAGTEWGMYLSFDDGASWTPFQLDLPIVAIRDLHVRDGSLIAATHGRSFWMIDDLKPLHHLTTEVAAKDFHLFPPKPSYRMAERSTFGRVDHRLEGENHPHGVMFHYFLKGLDEENDVALEILATEGDVIRRFDAKELEPKEGGNRFVWDMRYTGFTDFPGMILYASPNRGPKAVPGNYRARLTVNGESVEQEFEIVKDPRLPNTPEDYQKQFDYLIKVRDRVSEAHQAILDIRSARDDIERLTKTLEGEEDHRDLVEAADALVEELTVIETTIHETRNQSFQDPLNYGIQVNNRLAFLLADQQRGDFPPTDQAELVFEELSLELERELVSLQTLLGPRLDELNTMIRERGIPRIRGSE